jgi:putative tryptophan/tyrosine transport system substrate-binding protein
MAMRRRDFVTGIAGSAAAWPLAARAQQTERPRRIGVLMPFAAGDREVEARKPIFEGALRQLGWTLGANLLIEYRLTVATLSPSAAMQPNWLRWRRT